MQNRAKQRRESLLWQVRKSLARFPAVPGVLPH